MKTSEIIEGNKLIAEFMNGIYSENANAWGFGNARIEHKTKIIQGKKYENLVWAERWEVELKYHSSWDWLIPVVEKIESLNNYTRIETPINKKELRQTYCNIDGKEEFKTYSKSKIEALWLAVVEFIKWYNENK